MDLTTYVVLAVTATISMGFVALQFASLRDARRTLREERARLGPKPRAEIVRAVVVVVAIYSALGIAFYVGWRIGGLSEASIAAVSLAACGAVAAAIVGIRSALVKKD